MTERPPSEIEDLAPGLARNSALWVGFALLAGAFLGLSLLPRWIPGMAASLGGDLPHAPWYLCRVTGLIALVLLWATTCAGLMLSGRIARQRAITPAVLDLHQHLALMALAFAAVHALLLLADRYVGLTGLEVALPFFSRKYRPFWMGLGQVAYLGCWGVTLSFYLRRDLGRKVWRLLHGASGITFGMALIHGYFTGSSSRSPAIAGLYGAAFCSTALLLAYRLHQWNGKPKMDPPVTEARE